MIIFGTRGVTTNPQKGTFCCPQCGVDSPFRWRRVRRFFTLYFIPLIPLDKLGEYIECDQCRGTYNIEVLEFDPKRAAIEIEAEYQSGMRQIMIAMLLADGVIDDSEVLAVQRIQKELSGHEPSQDALRQEIGNMQASGDSVDSIVSNMSGMLNTHGKEKVVEAAYLVAMSDGEFHESEQVLLYQIGKDLGLSKSHFSGLMTTLMAGERITDPGDGTPSSLPPSP